MMLISADAGYFYMFRLQTRLKQLHTVGFPQVDMRLACPGVPFHNAVHIDSGCPESFCHLIAYFKGFFADRRSNTCQHQRRIATVTGCHIFNSLCDNLLYRTTPSGMNSGDYVLIRSIHQDRNTISRRYGNTYPRNSRYKGIFPVQFLFLPVRRKRKKAGIDTSYFRFVYLEGGKNLFGRNSDCIREELPVHPNGLRIVTAILTRIHRGIVTLTYSTVAGRYKMRNVAFSA